MKKLYGIIIASFIIFMCLPINVYAKDQAVTLTSSTAEAARVSVKGTTEAAAVMVQVRDANDNILGLQTFGTLNKEFSGDVTGLSLAADTDYKVFVADYEGGNWATSTVKYAKSSDTTPSDTPAPSNNTPGPAATSIEAQMPKTGGFPYVMLLGFAGAGIILMGGFVLIKNRK